MELQNGGSATLAEGQKILSKAYTISQIRHAWPLAVNAHPHHAAGTAACFCMLSCSLIAKTCGLLTICYLS
jgi:hypothetical protein